MAHLGTTFNLPALHTISPSEGPQGTETTESLVARATTGDAKAFDTLYRQCSGRIMAVCLRLTGDRQTAEELVHDTFVQAWKNLASFMGNARFETWLHRLAVNVVLEFQRSARRRAARVEAAAEFAAISLPPANVEARLDLERAIALLPEQARIVFVLHDVEGYKHEEIAEQLGLAPGTVRAHLHRARHHLMQHLDR